MPEIQFYQLTTSPLDRALPKLLEKAVAAGHRIVVLAGNEARMEQLNTSLWTYSPNSFLPHGSRKDPNPEKQPIYITDTDEAPNNPDILVVTDGSQLEVDAPLKKVLDMFDGSNEEAVAKARTRWKHYQSTGHSVTYYQQTETGGWKKAA